MRSPFTLFSLRHGIFSVALCGGPRRPFSCAVIILDVVVLPAGRLPRGEHHAAAAYSAFAKTSPGRIFCYGAFLPGHDLGEMGGESV